jgi:hypothetical protein
MFGYQAVEVVVFAGEIGVGPGERSDRIFGVLESGFGEDGFFLKAGGNDGCLERFFVGQVFVDRGRADAEVLRDTAHRERRDATFFQELAGGG